MVGRHRKGGPKGPTKYNLRFPSADSLTLGPSQPEGIKLFLLLSWQLGLLPFLDVEFFVQPWESAQRFPSQEPASHYISWGAHPGFEMISMHIYLTENQEEASAGPLPCNGTLHTSTSKVRIPS